MVKALVLLALLASIAANAQKTPDSSGRVFLFSSIGLSFLESGVNPSYSSSVQTATGIGYNASLHSSVGLALSFDSYGYKKSGTAYDLSGTLRATALALLYKYSFGNRSLQPYLKAGGGGVRLLVPTVLVNQGTTSISNASEILSFLLAEAGFQVGVHTRYSLFIGAEGRWFANSNLLNGTHLQPTTIKLGLISAF